jgi:pyruvate/2-oxoglutarate/acetoin dehydrogenase E1 component
MGKFLMSYLKEIKKSMKFLAKNNNSIFLGQSVKVPGNLLYNSLKEINNANKIELPIFEDTQMGICIGLALNGFIPISCYPRFDFFILSLNQTINHLDKMKNISSNEFDPFVLVRVLVGSKRPIDAGLQHTQNYFKEIKSMCRNLDVINLKNEKQIFKSYKYAFKKKKSTIFIEYSELY